MFKMDKRNPTILIEKNEEEQFQSILKPKFAEIMAMN